MNPVLEPSMDLFVSIGCIIVTLSISQFLRELARDKLSKRTLFRQLCVEFVGCFEMAAIAYECSVPLGVGGLVAFAITVFAVWYWRTQNWHEVSASPCSFIVDWVTGKIGLNIALFTVIAQLAGGFFAHRYYSTLYWNLGLIHSHTANLNAAIQPCTSHIQASPLVAAAAEGTGIFIIIMFATLIGRVKYLNGVSGLLNAFLGTSLVVLAIDKSGGYFNPMLASSMQYGCTGSTLLEHLQVYWVANTVGTLAAYYTDAALVSLFSKVELKKFKSTTAAGMKPLKKGRKLE